MLRQRKEYKVKSGRINGANSRLGASKFRDATIAAYLDAASLRHVVSSYTNAYYRARGQWLAVTMNGMALKDESEEEDDRKKNDVADDPRARLLACVEACGTIRLNSRRTNPPPVSTT